VKKKKKFSNYERLRDVNVDVVTIGQYYNPVKTFTG
jgi:lipoate synthase